LAYVRCSDEIHRRMKVKAAEMGISIGELLTMAVSPILEGSTMPIDSTNAGIDIPAKELVGPGKSLIQNNHPETLGLLRGENQILWSSRLHFILENGSLSLIHAIQEILRIGEFMSQLTRNIHSENSAFSPELEAQRRAVYQAAARTPEGRAIFGLDQSGDSKNREETPPTRRRRKPA